MPNGGASTAAVRRQDRRRCVRRKVLANGEMIPVDLGPMESGLLLDICARGASVQGLKPLRPGVRISLKFRLPGAEVSVQPTYEVIWADPNGRIGLKFLYIAEREQRLLSDWAAHYLPQPVSEVAVEPRRDSAPAPQPSEIPAAMTLEQELARVIEQATGYTSAEGGAIALREQQGIVCRASWGNAPDVGVMLNPDSGLSGECIRTGTAVLCTDALDDPRVDPGIARQLNLRSALVVPITIEDSVQGLIEVLSSRRDAFTPAHRQSLERLAEIVGFLIGPPIAPPVGELPRATAANVPEREPPVPAPPAQPHAVLPPEHLPAESAPPSAPVTSANPVADAGPAGDPANDVAGMIQLIEPELNPAPSPVVEDQSTTSTGTTGSDLKAPPSGDALEPSTIPLASFEQETRHGLRVSIFAAVVVLCGILLGAVWYLGPRWLSKGSQRPAATAPATPRLRSPESSASPPLPQVQPIQSNRTPSGASQTTPARPRRSAVGELIGADDMKIATWVEGGRLPAKRTSTSVTEAAPPLVGVPAASGLPQMPASIPATPVRLDTGSRPLRIAPQTMLDRAISRPSPEYPEEARRDNIDGLVTLMVIVAADGRVEMAAPINGPAILGVAAARAVRQWRFRPYLQDGKPVRIETTVTVGFRRG